MLRTFSLAILAMMLALATWGVVSVAWTWLDVVPSLGLVVGGFAAALVLAFFLWRMDVAMREEKERKRKSNQSDAQ